MSRRPANRGNSTGRGRAGVSRRQATGELHRAGARGCVAPSSYGGTPQGGGARVCRAVKLRENSTGGARGVSRRQAKGELHRAGARGCVAPSS